MARLMKNRTDNDIKNKWNSMKRARGRKTDPVNDTTTPDEAIAGVQQVHHVKALRCTAMSEVATNPQRKLGNIPPCATMKTDPSMQSFASGITLTVSDGGSAENSPLPKKMYWEGQEYEV